MAQKPAQESELILNPDTSIYHLNLKVGELADRIIFVGDPDRVEQVSRHFDKIEFKVRKREFYTITGYLHDQRISVMSTGIGTDNIDIVWNEIDALFNFDFNTRQIKTQLTQLHVLRLGTCGGLRPENPVGTIVNSSYAIGADGLMHFYNTSTFHDPEFHKAFQNFKNNSLPNTPPLYTSSGSKSFSQLLTNDFPHIKSGITFTAAGFYGPQGRNLGRLGLRSPNLTTQLQEFGYQGLAVLNMEMETAGILSLGKGLGHEAASLSVILANRSRGEFHPAPKQAVENLIEQGLDMLLKWE